MKKFDVAILGDGFCSLVTTAQLLHLKPELKIAVIGRSDDWGPGLPYGRCHPWHLLNVPAKNMGAFTHSPEDFLNWLKKNAPTQDINSFETLGRKLSDAFVPRALYGAYLRTIADVTKPRVLYIRDNAVSIHFKNNLFQIAASTCAIESNYVVLAIGVPKSYSSGKTEIDPWDFDFSSLENSYKSACIVGTGLTMVDVAASLVKYNFKGKIIAVSRRGLLPKSHTENSLISDIPIGDMRPLEGTVSCKLRAFRKNVETVEKLGIAWQSYFDLFRKETAQQWKALSVAEQRKFLHRVLPYWNIHRHRQPQQMEDLLQTLISKGQLEIRKGNTIPQADFVFNCRGPNYSFNDDPLIKRLMEQDMLRSNPNGIGMIFDQKMSAEGAAQGKLYAAGCLAAGMSFEATSVPDLRAQCAIVAKTISSADRGSG